MSGIHNIETDIEEWEDCDKNRTPSGSVISDKSDIRTFFRNINQSSEKAQVKDLKVVQKVSQPERSQSARKLRKKKVISSKGAKQLNR